jgi:3-dehydroquinate synthetase
MNISYNVNNEKHDVFYLKKNLDQITTDIEKLKSDKKILFLYDKNVSNKTIEEVHTQLKFSGCKVFKIEFLGSKKNKSLKAILKIIDFMILEGFTKKSIILSMGGGVLGDLSALAASLYMRGVIYLHIPTTMTSMVDSCIGGKTAINYQNIINSIGTYYHANKVYILDDFVKDLPDREFFSGIPEILKCGLIKDKTILGILKQKHIKIKNRDSDDVKSLCFKSLNTKIHFFKDDIFEKKERLMLNFGHTFAHSIEMALEKNNKSKEDILRHGEAVGLGIICEIKYASEMNNNDILDKTIELLNLYNLPTNLKFLNLDKQKMQNDIFKYLFLDKKRISKFPRYIKLTKLCNPKIDELNDYSKINHIINELL